MADSRGGVTDALMAQPTGGYPGQAVATRGGVPQSPSPYGSGFTSFAPRPQMTPQASGFAPPPANMQSGGGFAPPPRPSGFAPPPASMAPGAAFGGGGFAPTPRPGGFVAPPTPGMPRPVAPTPTIAPPPRPAFNSMFSPGALANPGGNAMRGGRGF
jgi:hypothetical protein